MKITTFSVPIGALLGLFVALNLFPTAAGILLATLIGGLLGGVIGLVIKGRMGDNK